MRILVYGGAGGLNSGDEALLRSAVQTINTIAPSAGITYFSLNDKLARKTLSGFDVEYVPSPRSAFFASDPHYWSCDEVFRARWTELHAALVGVNLASALETIASSEALSFINRDQARQCLLAIAHCQAVVVHGGGVLSSPTRSRLWEIGLTVEIAAGLGKRVLLRSHQFGPYSNDEDEARAQSILRLSAYLSTRDQLQSSCEASRLVPGVSVVDQVDDAFILRLEPDVETDTLAEHGLKAGEYICVGYRHNPSVGVDGECIEKTARVVSAARRRLGLPVVLLPQGNFDEPHLNHLASLLDFETRLVVPRVPIDGTIEIASNARLMVACPHHSLIFALRGGVAVLSPVMGDYYKFKNVGSMRLFGLEDSVIDIAPPPDVFMPIVEERLDRIERNGTAIRTCLMEKIAVLCETAAQQDGRFARVLLGADKERPVDGIFLAEG